MDAQTLPVAPYWAYCIQHRLKGLSTSFSLERIWLHIFPAAARGSSSNQPANGTWLGSSLEPEGTGGHTLFLLPSNSPTVRPGFQVLPAISLPTYTALSVLWLPPEGLPPSHLAVGADGAQQSSSSGSSKHFEWLFPLAQHRVSEEMCSLGFSLRGTRLHI